MNDRQHFERVDGHEIRPLSNLDYLPLLAGLLPWGIVAIDERFRVLEANHSAAALLRAGGGLKMSADGCVTTEYAPIAPDFEAYLRRILFSNSNSGMAKPAHFVTPRSAALPILIIGLRCIRSGVSGQAPSARAILCLREFEERQKKIASPEDLRVLYKFTAAEAMLARSLLAGKTLAEHSKERQVSVNTTKTHLKAVLAKAGVRRQADLVRVLLDNGWIGESHLFG